MSSFFFLFPCQLRYLTSIHFLILLYPISFFLSFFFFFLSLLLFFFSIHLFVSRFLFFFLLICFFSAFLISFTKVISLFFKFFPTRFTSAFPFSPFPNFLLFFLSFVFFLSFFLFIPSALLYPFFDFFFLFVSSLRLFIYLFIHSFYLFTYLFFSLLLHPSPSKIRDDNAPLLIAVVFEKTFFFSFSVFKERQQLPLPDTIAEINPTITDPVILPLTPFKVSGSGELPSQSESYLEKNRQKNKKIKKETIKTNVCFFYPAVAFFIYFFITGQHLEIFRFLLFFCGYEIFRKALS